MNTPLGEMFRYNLWANSTLLEACRKLNERQLQTHPEGVSGSVAELITHIVGAQQTFILRTKGRQSSNEMGRHTPWPGIDTLINMAKDSSVELITIAEELEKDREVALPFKNDIYEFPLSFFLTHAFEHGVEHRTEVKIALKFIGIETPDLDGWAYAQAAGHGRAVKKDK